MSETDAQVGQPSAFATPVCILQVDPAAQIVKPSYQFKAVFNDRGIIVGPGSIQHDGLRAPGIWYAHDHKGNALATMIYASRIEVRGHASFTPERVRLILTKLAALPGLAPLRGFAVTYRNQPLGQFRC